ncbi:MAG: DUF357 domain-containing protein [Candidatus Aenigmarchaeota archaeon]|nr:DUF357 domain-containing protein [Candidatus Aenigmarchaeota archaeon]
MVRKEIELEEIEKQFKKLKEELKDVKPNSKKGEEFLKNIRAYVNDTEHFIEKGDYVLAFECIVWAWAWYEIGKELGML